MGKAKARKSRKNQFQVINPYAAGIDVGSRFHVVAVSPEHDSEPVRKFNSFTTDLHRLADWLKAAEVTTIAMESTGVYWIPVFEILESRGFQVILVNAREAKRVPGRKTDIKDAQWIQQLHQYGLLSASFHPGEKIASLRSYLRHRERLTEYAAAHIQHMQKALMQMNLQLQHVVSDITGDTGMRIIRAIIEGERSAVKLASYRDERCKESEKTIAAALNGNYRPEHVFSLKQAVALYDFYQKQIKECDQEIEKALDALSITKIAPSEPLPEARQKRKHKNEPAIPIREKLYALTGVDSSQISGIGPYTALRLIGECGTDMTKWPTSKHFTSWLSLSPGSKISGGKVLSSRTRRTKNRATTLLRIAAVNIGRTQTALGAFYRRLAARVGKAKAVTATARKLAVLFYTLMRYGKAYVEPGADYYERQYKERLFRALSRKAAVLGYSLVQKQENPPIMANVS